MFLANYSDALSDLPLDTYVRDFEKRDQTATFISVKPNSGFHFVEADAEGTVSAVRSIEDSENRVNGGFFILRQEIFDYLGKGEELVQEPFQRLIKKRKLHTYRYDGFWQCMDTFKDKQRLDELMERDVAPWQVWKRSRR
jgi:glucose-1-phosphate cytidylyltransferase